jgi:hypothetical protein
MSKFDELNHEEINYFHGKVGQNFDIRYSIFCGSKNYTLSLPIKKENLSVFAKAIPVPRTTARSGSSAT